MNSYGIACGLALALAGVAPVVAQPAPANLEGIWTNAFLTGFERFKDHKSLSLTEAEARAYETNYKPPVDEKDTVGQEESEFPERGAVLARIRGVPRTSMIYDPATGKVPWTKAAADANKARGEAFGAVFDNPEQRPLSERCLGVGHAGPPIRNGPDLNVHRIVQTKDHVVIASEYMGAVRIIPIGAPAGGLPQWGGNAAGRWEGGTLVVETVGFHPLQNRRPDGGPATKQRVIERFTRTSPTELHYHFTVENPDLYAQTWRGEMIFGPAPAIHEYACHEGNYALANILAGGRTAEREAAAKAASATRAD